MKRLMRFFVYRMEGWGLPVSEDCGVKRRLWSCDVPALREAGEIWRAILIQKDRKN